MQNIEKFAKNVADFNMVLDIITCNSLQSVLYQHGPLAQASTADIITETMSSEDKVQRIAMRKCDMSDLCLDLNYCLRIIDSI